MFLNSNNNYSEFDNYAKFDILNKKTIENFSSTNNKLQSYDLGSKNWNDARDFCREKGMILAGQQDLIDDLGTKKPLEFNKQDVWTPVNYKGESNNWLQLGNKNHSFGVMHIEKTKGKPSWGTARVSHGFKKKFYCKKDGLIKTKGLCRRNNNTNDYGGYCVKSAGVTEEQCSKHCSDTKGCVAAGHYAGDDCDLFFQDIKKPTNCPSGFKAYKGESTKYTDFSGLGTNYGTRRTTCSNIVNNQKVSPTLNKEECAKFAKRGNIKATYSNDGIWKKENATSRKMAQGCLFWRDSGGPTVIYNSVGIGSCDNPHFDYACVRNNNKELDSFTTKKEGKPSLKLSISDCSMYAKLLGPNTKFYSNDNAPADPAGCVVKPDKSTVYFNKNLLKKSNNIVCGNNQYKLECVEFKSTATPAPAIELSSTCKDFTLEEAIKNKCPLIIN